MAKAKVDMLLGTYQWSDGRKPVRGDGTPVVENRELLRVGDYNVNYKNGGRALFDDSYFEKQVKLEMARRENYLEIAATEPINEMIELSQLMFNELRSRLDADPSSFTTTQLLQYAPEWKERGQKLLGGQDDGDGPRAINERMAQFNAFIGKTVVVMNDDERESFVDSAAQAHDARLDRIQKMIDAANALDADAEEPSDADVIDATLHAEPT
jgi:hypothetical protein